ncbi:hypothetical protein C9374_001151 [Naegleria lovaniensis]|uniref:Uncharacterized protein n=1 Tax=Naegleria lovaniensis TaxID=51637 RepID=A0AA88GV53_NAELO|nr:uncharacterized protein C9374_001151 [Naegleria lovaniensis]KAG2387557.1 hypothetical protein C9374_001151 [Naegleria lovaniensis]
MRVMSILALIFNVCAFAVIAGVIIHSFSVINNPRADILSLRGDALYNCLLMEEATRHASYANNLTAAKLWYQYRDAMVDALSGIFDVLQQSGSTINISTLVDPVKKDPMVIPIIKSNNRLFHLSRMDVHSKLKNSSFPMHGRFKDQIINSTSITTVSVVGTNLTLIIPVMFVIFLLTIKRDKDASKKLRQAELLLLKDTIANGGLRTLFRNFIVEKAEGSRNLRLLNQYMFLEKVQYYKDLNLKLFEIQIKMERQEFENKRQVKSPQFSFNL